MDGPDDPVVLFDMDGVVLEGRGADPVVHERALDDALAERGLTVSERRRAALSGYEYTEAFAEACRAVGVDPEGFYAERERHSARRIAERVRAGVRGLYPDVDALAGLAERYRLGLVSNNYHTAVEAVVDHHALEVFTVVRGREPGLEGFRRRKPEPYYLLETMERLGADRGLYVGDRETDMVAAERAGLEGVFVAREHNADVELEVEPAARIGSLADLAALDLP
jgi:HAD superfamily hydrolase (TIGR01549 family)